MNEFRISEGTRLVIADEALAVLQRYLQSDTMNEAGGILLGRDYVGKRVVIEEVTTPAVPDSAGPRWFNRSRDRAQRAVNSAWEESCGELIYLGEWHSHPQDDPTPSDRDITMISDMHAQTKMEIDFTFLVIVGRRSLWVGMQTATGLRQLKAIAFPYSYGEISEAPPASGQIT